MKLKHVRWVCYALLAIFFLFCFLMFVHLAFGLGTIIAVLALGYFNLTYYRCPHCHEHLGREIGAFCQHCGKPLDQN